MLTYTTIQGDTWDKIAREVYGSEMYADYLMQNNYEQLDTFVFSSGIKLRTPTLTESASNDLPEWRS